MGANGDRTVRARESIPDVSIALEQGPSDRKKAGMKGL